MKKLEQKDIQTMDAKAIDAKVHELRQEIFQMRMQAGAFNLEKPHQLQVAKKNIARLLNAKNMKG